MIRRIALPALLALVVLWPQPYLEALRSPNELVRVYLTRAIVDDGTVKLDEAFARYGPLADHSKRDGHTYCDKAPGLSLLAVPFYATLRLFFDAHTLSNRFLVGLFRALLLAIPTLLWLPLFARWLDEIGLSPPLTRLGPVAYLLATPALVYCLQLYGHQAAAWMGGTAIIAAWRARNRLKGPWATYAGFFAALSTITEYPTAPILGVAAVLTLWGHANRKAAAVRFLVGAAPVLVLGAVYHTVAFGGPLTTGYQFIANAGFNAMHAQGVSGVGLPSLEAAWELTVGQQRGLLPLAPWIGFALFALFDTNTRRRPLRRALWCVIGAQFAVATGFGYWLGGWSVGPRHLVTALPALATLALIGMDRTHHRLLMRRLAGGSLVAGAFLCGAIAMTFPAFPEELRTPIWELTAPLLGKLQGSHTLGTLVGMAPRTSMLVSMTGVLCCVGWIARGTHPSPTTAHRLARTASAGWIALLFCACLWYWAPRPSDMAVFRTHWLTETVWEPPASITEYHPTLTHWEKAQRRLKRGAPTADDFEAIAAMQKIQGQHDAALRSALLATAARRGLSSATPDTKLSAPP